MESKLITDNLDSIIGEYDSLLVRSTCDDCSDVMSETKAIEIITRASAAVDRATPRGSAYRRQIEDILVENSYEHYKVQLLVGVLQALRADIKRGYLQTLEQLVHGELFGDFLDMARHLVESGYKDPAAVVAGSSLEGHLRQLAKLASVDLMRTTQKGQEPKKADTLNAELAKVGAYSVTDQKNVTAWLGLRNNAAHGNYAEYEKGQVSIMIDGIRDFITRVPA